MRPTHAQGRDEWGTRAFTDTQVSKTARPGAPGGSRPATQASRLEQSDARSPTATVERPSYKSRRRTTPTSPRMPEPNSMMLLGSGTEVVLVVVVVLLVVPKTVNDSEGIEPTEFSEAIDGPEFSSQ